jgi:signal transduction histidine kinase
LRSANETLGERVAERTHELDQRNHELAFVTRKVLETQEIERRSVALELHDDIGQDLAALNMLHRSVLHGTGGALNPVISEHIAECVEITQSIYDRVGDIALKLRPSVLDRLGFTAGLNWYIRQAAKRADCEISALACDVPENLPEPLAIGAFRIVQEAVSNALRHARASTIQVSVIGTERRLSVRISDDGVGFDMSAVKGDSDPFAGFGVLGMMERARIAGGTLTVESSPGNGTRIVALLPLPEMPLPEMPLQDATSAPAPQEQDSAAECHGFA